MPNILPKRFSAFRELRGLTQSEMGNLLGITGKYVGMIERGEKDVDDESSLGLLFRIQEEKQGSSPSHDLTTLREEEPAYRVNKYKSVRIIGWAHAGEAGIYEELPHDWQETIATDCPKEKIFGVKLEGDSMEPRFSTGDILILMTEERVYNGCYAVVKFKNDGILFRRIEFTGDKVQLVPLNERYNASDHSFEEFEWIYPVWARVTRLWNR